MKDVFSTPEPPRRADALLAWFCDADLLEDIQGDIHELFYKRVQQQGVFQARLHYWWDVLWFLRPYLFRQRSPQYEQAFGFIMWKNYSKVAVRSLRKHKGYAAINLFGLASGMACCIVIYFFVQHERTYDRFHEHIDTLVKVEGRLGEHHAGVVQAPLAEALHADLPEVVATARIADEDLTLRKEERLFTETVHFVDPSFLEMFSFKVQGNASGAAALATQGIILSAEMQEKHFGTTSAVGQSLDVYIDGRFVAFEIVGVAEPLPSNSSVTFNMLMPITQWPNVVGENALSDWGNFAVTTFLQLQDHEALRSLEAKIPDFIQRHVPSASNSDGPHVSYMLYPFADYHLSEEMNSSPGLKPSGSERNIYILSGIALLIMLMASFNFMTLTIGRASTRIKELGMRKVLGAKRGQLVAQLWGEALFLSLVALGLGIIGATVLLPVFNALVEVSLSINNEMLWASGLMLLGIGLAVGVVAGFYPALVLSRFKTLAIYKDMTAGRSGSRFTRVLVTLQFALSLCLIAGALGIAQQHHYLQSKDLGFNKDALVVVSMQTTQGTRAQGDIIAEQFEQALANEPSVIRTTASSAALVHGTSAGFFHQDGELVIVFNYRVDEDFLATTGIELLSGRNFSPDFSSDVDHAILVNEAFVERFGTEGFPEDAVGIEDPTIIGVVKDFHFHRLHNVVAPLYLRMKPDRRGAAIRHVLVRVRPDDMPATLARLEAAWQTIRPDKPFDYFFLDEELDQQYKAEARWATMLRYASMLAILIACLGLLGLTALATARRTKEIGIRKVMGASVSGLVGLLSHEFLVLMLIANVIAWPLAYWAMSVWLQDFAYRISLGLELFVVAALITLLITWGTVGMQAFKAARANPVDALRYE